MDSDITLKIAEGLSTAGPLGVAFYFVGKAVLKAWSEDRKTISSLIPQCISIMSRCVAVLERIEERLHETKA